MTAADVVTAASQVFHVPIQDLQRGRNWRDVYARVVVAYVGTRVLRLRPDALAQALAVSPHGVRQAVKEYELQLRGPQALDRLAMAEEVRRTAECLAATPRPQDRQRCAPATPASTRPPAWTMEANLISQAAAGAVGATVHELVGPGRARGLSLGRQAAWYLIRQRIGATLSEIGALYHRDHTTVLSGIRRVQAALAGGPEAAQFRNILARIEATLRGTVPPPTAGATPDQLIAEVAETAGLSPAALYEPRGPGRGAAEIARAAAIYLLRTQTNLTWEQIGAAFGRTGTVAAEIARGVKQEIHDRKGERLELYRQALAKVDPSAAERLPEPIKDSGNVRVVLEAAAQAVDLSPADLRSYSRSQRAVRGRSAAMYWLRMHDDMTLSAIGRAMGRDHTTVLHGVRAVERALVGAGKGNARLDEQARAYYKLASALTGQPEQQVRSAPPPKPKAPAKPRKKRRVVFRVPVTPEEEGQFAEIATGESRRLPTWARDVILREAQVAVQAAPRTEAGAPAPVREAPEAEQTIPSGTNRMISLRLTSDEEQQVNLGARADGHSEPVTWIRKMLLEEVDNGNEPAKVAGVARLRRQLL